MTAPAHVVDRLSSTFVVARALLAMTVLGGCKEPPPQQTMTGQQVNAAVRDYAERGCACETDKECFRAIRDEWDAAKRELVKNARLLRGAEQATYEAARKQFGLCGDGAGLTVFDKW